MLDLDIKGFFDNIVHDLLLMALQHYDAPKWVCMYVERWLKAGVVQENGQRITNEKDTP